MDDATTSNGALDENLQTVSTNLLEGLGQLASYFGFNKVMGQLFGALLLSPEPMSLDDLMERLGISKASVSTHMRTLEHMGIVHEVWVKDDRRKFYRAESDFWVIVGNVLSSRELRDVNRALSILGKDADRLQEAIGEMSESDHALAELYIERITQLQDFFGLAQMLLMSFIAQVQEKPDARTIKGIEFE